MAMGKHYGSFAKGFMDSILAVYKLKMTKDLYDARAQYYKDRGDAARENASTRANKGAGIAGAEDASGAAWGHGTAPRGVRNNNPGNIEDGAFAKSQPGYVGSDGRFAKFDSVASGNNALDGLLTKNYSGMTVGQLINKYAPPGENNSTAYAATVAKRLGIDVNAVPNLNDQGVRDTLKQSIISVEQGIPFERVPDYLAGNTGQNPALVDATGKVLATGGADPTQLHPAFVSRVVALSAEAEKATGQKLSFNELHRTTEQQAEIRARHEAMPGGVVAHPAAPAGSSYHEFGAAGDMDNNKAATWARTPGPDGRTPIQKAGLEQLGGQTGKNDPLHIQLPKADWDKTASNDSIPTKGPNAGKAPKGDGSYQVAGDTGIALTPEQAAKAQADLEAHRAAPDATRPPTVDPASAGAGTSVSPVPSPGTVHQAPTPPPGWQPPAPAVTPRGGEAEINAPLGGGVYDARTVDPTKTSYVVNPRTGNLEPPPPPGSQPGGTPIGGGAGNVMEAPTGAPAPVATINPATDTSSYVQPSRPTSTGRMPVDTSPAARNMPYVGETATGNQRDPRGVYAPSAVAPDTGARPDLTARSPATAIPPTATANVPVTPGSSPGAAGSTPGFVQVDRPNANPVGRDSVPKTTALDLSHLWGPNPPLSQQASAPAPTPTPMSNSPLPTRLPDDMAANADLGDQIMGSAKGGPIQRFSRGGIPTRPTMRFAAAGAVPNPTYTPASTSPVMGTGSAMEAAQAGYQPFGHLGQGFWNQQSGVPYADPTSGADVAADLATLNPAQQQWYSEQYADQSNTLSPGYTGGAAGNWFYNPASYSVLSTPAATPAAAPAAAPTATPAPVAPTAQTITAPAATTTITDPTTTTTTGAPSLPNSITAKSYDPNVDAQTGASFANTSNTGGTNYSVGTDDLLQQNAAGNISGVNQNTVLSRKGGPIRRFANGGAIPARPMTKFAAAGPALNATQTANQAYMQAEWSNPNSGYIGPTAGGGWVGTPESQLAPNQQAWATQQQQALSGGNAANWGLLTNMPTAAWPTTAPAAPTPLNEPAPAAQSVVNQGQPIVDIATIDPTATTTTGAPGLPNSITAKSYDPNVDAQTGAGFANTSNTGGTNYNVGSDDLLQQTTPGTISGVNQNTILSRKGGPITQRVNKYDDGGGVSPSAAGMPPGLGGQQAIPPIYFNPATYSAAGAPVGKGITQNSATTFNAGAIPSLPMVRGGVVAFDDGGGVGDDPLTTMQSLDFADMRDNDTGAAPAATPAAYTPTQYNSAGEPTTDVDPTEFLQPSAPTSGNAGAGSSSGGRGSDVPPPDQTTPQIHDGQGNPSRGLIAAIGDGLHWLGDHLELVGGAQAAGIASDPQTQTNRQNHVNYSPDSATYMSPKDAAELDKINDPQGQLSDAYRNIARLEGGYKFAMSQGDTQTAGRLAAAILHYSVITSQNLSDQASKALYNGDIKGAIEKANEASDAVPDGRLTHMTLNPDGKTVTVQGKDLDGRVLWQKQGAAASVLERATSMGKDGKLQWNALESQAARYDSTFANMQKARQGNATAQAKEDAATASEARVAGAVGGNILQPVTRTGNAAPATPPTGAPGGPGVPASATVPAATPAVATAPAPLDRGPTGHGGALSPAPTTGPAPDQPAAGGQEVSFDQVAARINNQETQANNSDLAKIQGKYFTPEGNILYGGQEYARPAAPNVQGLNPAEQRQALQAYAQGPLAQYNAMVKTNQDQMNKEISENKDMRSKQFQTMRDQARDQFSQGQQTGRMREQEGLIDKRAGLQSQRDAILNSQKNALDQSNAVFKSNLAGSAPRSDQEMNSLAGEGKTYDPAVMMARAFNPDLPEDTNRVTAMNDLKQKGFDANTQGVLANAWHNAVRNSHGVDPEEVGTGIQSFITGNPFTATAEAVDANGQPAQRHGDVRYAVTMEDNTGNHISMLLSQNDLANLRNLRYQYSRQQGANLANTISTKGVLGALGGAGERGAPPTSIPEWQQRTPAEQTQAPPF